jgi:hypothetical protein
VKNFLVLFVATLACGSLLSGCQSPSATIPSQKIEKTPAQSARNNAYSLLHQLLDDEKDVSMLRFIKREHSDVKDLVKKIATTSKAGSKLLEKFAKMDPSLALDHTDLPSGETATRDAIAATKKHALLSQKGDEFELTLLLTQTEALNYAWHLAQVAGENDLQPDRSQALARISDDMKNLYQEVFALLLLKQTSPAANKIPH